MEDRPLVSVVIPAWNAAETLPALLESVTAQTWRELQILVIDDGSRDGTLAAARAAAEKDPRITVVHQANAGVSAARNRALPLCAGKYIRFADADDFLPPDSVEIMVRRMERDGADLAIGGYTERVGDLRRFKNLANRDDTVSWEELLRHLCPHANSYFYGVLWNKLFVRRLVEEGGVRFCEDRTWGEDAAFVMDYLQRADRIAFLREAVYEYIRSPGSATVQQALDSVVHPVVNSRAKAALYGHLKDLYTARGVYPEYRRRLWIYMIRVGLG